MSVGVWLTLASGLLVGVAQLHPSLAPLAWLGAGARIAGVDLTTRPVAAGVALFAAAAVQYGVTLSWWVEALMRYQNLDRPAAVLMFLAGIALISTLVTLPVVPFLTRRWPAVLWLPPAWLVGEAIVEQMLDLAWGQWLYTQWGVPPVLRLLALVGWWPTGWLCLAIAGGLATSLTRRRWPLAVPCVAVLAVVALLPARNPRAEALTGIVAVAMADIEHRPEVPGGVRLVVWPEGAVRDRPRIEEGEGPFAARIDPLPGDPTDGHLIGLVARSDAGLQNAVVHVGHDGGILAMRAKRVLVPVGERPLLGIGPDQALIPGRSPPVLRAGPTVIPLVCFEAFSRALVAEGRAAGGEVIVVLSSDLSLVKGTWGLRQINGALVMRAAEYDLPAVRASLWGNAALIGADGSILVETAPGETRAIRLP